MSKQDGYASRTPADLERKYKFGETFAEVFGLASDARKIAEEAQSVVEGLDQDQIFNLLTNNGKAQGIYRDDNGDVYVNASYIKVGGIDGDPLLDKLPPDGAFATLQREFLVTQNVVSSTIGQYQTEVDGYSKQVSEYRQTVNGFSQMVSKYSGDVAGYAGELAALNAQVSQYNTAVQEYDAQIVTFNQTVSGFNASVQGYDEAVLGYAGELAALNTQVKGYADKVSGYESAVKGYDAQVSSFAQTVGGFNTTVVGYKETVDGYSAEYSAFNQSASSLIARVEDLEDGASHTLRLDKDGLQIIDNEGNEVKISGSQVTGGTIAGVTLQTVTGTHSNIVIDEDSIDFGSLASLKMESIYTGDDYDTVLGLSNWHGQLVLTGAGGVRVYHNGRTGRYWTFEEFGLCLWNPDGSLRGQIQAVLA